MRHSFFKFTIALALCCVILACNKSTTTSAGGSGSLLDMELVKRIPAGADAVMVASTENPAFQKYSTNINKGFIDQAIAQMKADATAGESKGAKVLARLVDTFSATVKDGKGPIKEMVAFGDLGSKSNLIDAAVYAEARDAAELTQLVTKIRQDLTAEQIAVTDATFGSVKGFTATAEIPGQDGAPPTTFPVHVAASGTRLAIASAGDLIQRGLSAEISQTAGNYVTDSEAFKRALAAVPVTSETTQYVFVDVLGAFDGAQQLAQQSGSPEGLGITRDQVPVTTVAMARDMGEQLSDRSSALWNPTSIQTNDWVGRFSQQQAKNTLAETAPAQTGFFMGFNGSAINTAIKLGMENDAEITPEMKAEADHWLGLLAQVRNYGIGVRNAGAAAPFPDVFVMIDTPQSETLRKELRTVVNQALSGISADPAAAMKPVKRDGLDYEFMLTPFGAGVFLGSAGDKVVVASSERGLVDALGGGSQNAAKALSSELSEKSRNVLVNQPTTLVTYLNFGLMADMAESVMGSIAMFAGGTENLSKTDIDYIRSLGTASVNLSVNKEALKFESVYELKKPA